MSPRPLGLLLASLALVAACSDDPAAEGSGTAAFTTWGEAFIEEGIPASPDGESGFIDGWSVRYSKFLVVLGGISVAAEGEAPVAAQTGTILVDNVNKAPKTLLSFGLPARAYDRVSYRIVPATADTELVASEAADRDFMAQNGYRIYVEGTATGPKGESKSFRWGFGGTVSYSECQAVENGKSTYGIVVTDGSTETIELTTHGDHLFYNRLGEGTTLHFQPLADADADGDGEVTLEELSKVDIKTLIAEPYSYDPSGLPAENLRALVEQLSRTVGHFRGEGECVPQ